MSDIATKLTTIAENQQKVYDAGYAAGQAAGSVGDTEAAYNEGFTAGQMAEYDRFWDLYQDKGNRTNYGSAFVGEYWNTNTFKPKYDIKLGSTTAGSAFNNFGDAEGIDLVKVLDELEVSIDFSSVISAPSIFNGANITTLPPIYAPRWINWSYTFYGCRYLKSIDYTSSADISIGSIQNAFTNCTSLTDVKFTDTTIAKSVSFQQSPLTRQSIESVMSALSTTATEQTATFQKAAVEAAFTTDEWNALVATRTNWTITLV